MQHAELLVDIQYNKASSRQFYNMIVNLLYTCKISFVFIGYDIELLREDTYVLVNQKPIPQGIISAALTP